MTAPITDQVRAYWEKEPCGTGPNIVGALRPLTPEWFAQVERHRYRVEPEIHAFAQFTRHRGSRVLEIGVGAGTDHEQWCRAGAEAHGIDLTAAALIATRERLELAGHDPRLQRVNAERLPFRDGAFDVVYSWGVIHHTERPDEVFAEVARVLCPGGEFIGMLYSRRSLLALRMWVAHGLRRGRPLRSFGDVIWSHMESVGTKAYTRGEVRSMLRGFSAIEVVPLVTAYDLDRLPEWIGRWIPSGLGWFLAIRAVR